MIVIVIAEAIAAGFHIDLIMLPGEAYFDVDSRDHVGAVLGVFRRRHDIGQRHHQRRHFHSRRRHSTHGTSQRNVSI